MCNNKENIVEKILTDIIDKSLNLKIKMYLVSIAKIKIGND